METLYESLLVNYSNAISIIDIGVSLIPDRKEKILKGFRMKTALEVLINFIDMDIPYASR